MRILFTTDTYHPNVDGVVRALDLLIPALESCGYEIVVLGPNTDPKPDNYIPSPGIRLPFYKEYQLVIPDMLKDLDVDLVHNHGLALTAIYGILLARRKKIPVIGHYHTDITKATHYIKMPSWIAEVYVRELLNRYDLTLSPSPMIKYRLNTLGVRDVNVLPIPIDVNRYYYSDTKDRFLLHVGRLVKEKKIDGIFEYLKDISMPLYIAGRGPAMEYYRMRAQEYGIDVEFLGFVSEERLRELYRDAYALVFNSDFDTLGLVCVEALASGTPVIAHENTAIADYIREFGLTFRDREGFIRAVKLAGEIDHRRMQEIANKFHIDNIIKEYISTYEKFLNKS